MGRKFWTCALPPGEACKSFCWVGEESKVGLKMDIMEDGTQFASSVMLEMVKEDMMGVTVQPYDSRVVAILKVCREWT